MTAAASAREYVATVRTLGLAEDGEGAQDVLDFLFGAFSMGELAGKLQGQRPRTGNFFRTFMCPAGPNRPFCDR